MISLFQNYISPSFNTILSYSFYDGVLESSPFFDSTVAFNSDDSLGF